MYPTRRKRRVENMERQTGEKTPLRVPRTGTGSGLGKRAATEPLDRDRNMPTIPQ